MSIRLRGLTVLFPNGFVTTVLIPSVLSTVSEVDSAREILVALDKYKNGIQRLIARSPSLSMGKGKVYSSFDELLHSMINARKYLDMDEADPDVVKELYYLDLTNSKITLYDHKSKTERGTMFLRGFYSNWQEMFYPEHVEKLPDPPETIEIAEELIVESIKEESAEEIMMEMTSEDVDEGLFNNYSKQMREQLPAEQYALWEMSMQLLVDAEFQYNNSLYMSIEYSGGGDSGQTDTISVTVPADSDDPKVLKEGLDYIRWNGSGYVMCRRVYLSTANAEYDEQIWKVIQGSEGGFYNDEGGRGVFVISPTTFKWQHYNYEQREDQTIDLDIDVLSLPTKDSLPF